MSCRKRECSVIYIWLCLAATGLGRAGDEQGMVGKKGMGNVTIWKCGLKLVVDIARARVSWSSLAG